jgi:hypothetical protein
MGLRPFACWDCGFESRRGHGCLSLVSVVCCQVDVSASGWSLVQRSPTECGVSECDCGASVMRRPWPTRGCCAMGENITIIYLQQTMFLGYSVAAILHIQFRVHVMLFSMLSVLHLYICIFLRMYAMPNMAVFCSSLMSRFPGVIIIIYFITVSATWVVYFILCKIFVCRTHVNAPPRRRTVTAYSFFAQKIC